MQTLTGTLEDITGGKVAEGTVTVQLRNYGSQIPRKSGAALFALLDVAMDSSSPDGTFSIPVVQNDLILPARTYYVVQVADSNGDVVQVNAYQFNGPDGTVDLSTVDPIDPSSLESDPLIEDLTVYVPWNAGNGIFDGTQGLVFSYYLQGNAVAPVFLNAVPGNLYTLILVQPSAGGKTFPFPANMHGAPDEIGLAPNSSTTLVFASRLDGSLDYTGLGVISRAA